MRKLIGLLLLGIALPTHADLTLRGYSTVWAMNMQGSGNEVIWISKNHLRRDLSDHGREYSQIYDLNQRRITLIDHALHKAETHSLSAISENVAKAAHADLKYTHSTMKFSLQPTGKARKLQSWVCLENNLRVSAPAEVAGEKVNFEMDGTVWVATKVREQAEVSEIVKALQSPDLYLDLPPLGRSPDQARALAETLRRILPTGMICGLEVNLQYAGNGRIAELSKKLASRLSLQIEGYDRKRIPVELFEIPKNYYQIQN